MTALVTVLMPVYNAEKYLADAIESVLQQTFRDFEFLIIDDGSTDKSVEIIKSYPDKRIVLCRNDINKGLIHTLNRGLQLAKGEYIIRMDSDDICCIDRLEKQVGFMQAHQDVSIAGAGYKSFGCKKSFVWQGPQDYEAVRSYLFFDSALAHPTIIMRTADIKKYNLCYDQFFHYCEDWAFWIKCSKYLKIVNMPDVVLKYRMLQTSQSRAEETKVKRLEKDQEILKANLFDLGVRFSDEEFTKYWSIYRNIVPFTVENMQNLEQYFIYFQQINQKNKYYNPKYFNEYLARNWFGYCYTAAALGKHSYDKCFESVLSRNLVLSWKIRIKFYLKTHFLRR
jgi:glycosyltransferase involved in cell wall biosynthesis